MISRWSYFGLFLGSWAIGFFFQNCMRHNFEANPQQELSSLSLSHPDPSSEPVLKATMPGGFILLDRIEVHSVLSDVFLTNISDPAVKADFQNVFNFEILSQQHMYGHPCDLLTDPSDCVSNYANLTIGMSQSSSTIRESSRIQMCRRLVARESLMKPLILRISGQDLTPTPESLQKAIQLFYPAWEDNETIIKLLANLDYKMAVQSETIQNRWRIILLTLCESPYWEIL